ncbi:hypothetical protein [Thiorhodococcus minor]|nr:hypothetical protein [Thiorhodococcus minor]
MDFDTIPLVFRPALKAILQHWDVEVRPRGASLTTLFYGSKSFLAYLERLQVTCLSQITAMHCASYAAHCRSLTGLDGKRLSRYTLANRFVAVEALQRWALGTPYAFSAPWPESSAAHLAGLTGQGPRRATTPVIPDDVLKSLFQAAVERLQGAERLFEAYSAVESERARLERGGSRNGSVNGPIRTLIRAFGFRDKRDFNAAYAELLPAAAIVILRPYRGFAFMSSATSRVVPSLEGSAGTRPKTRMEIRATGWFPAPTRPVRAKPSG